MLALDQEMLGSSNYSRRHDAEPEAALEALVSHDGPLLLDLDETAHLRNSTDDFLGTASPGRPALLLPRLLDAIRPWRWTGGEATRDLWRVRFVGTLVSGYGYVGAGVASRWLRSLRTGRCLTP